MPMPAARIHSSSWWLGTVKSFKNVKTLRNWVVVGLDQATNVKTLIEALCLVLGKRVEQTAGPVWHFFLPHSRISAVQISTTLAWLWLASPALWPLIWPVTWPMTLWLWCGFFCINFNKILNNLLCFTQSCFFIGNLDFAHFHRHLPNFFSFSPS